MDYSEALKRIYIYLDRLQQLSVGNPKVKSCVDNIRSYVDVIAKSVDYDTDDE